jgi:hypothetical protein
VILLDEEKQRETNKYRVNILSTENATATTRRQQRLATTTTLARRPANQTDDTNQSPIAGKAKTPCKLLIQKADPKKGAHQTTLHERAPASQDGIV